MFRLSRTLPLDVTLWVSAAVFATGGIPWKGQLRLSFINDFWTACALVYVLGRLFFKVRFSDTHFGRSWLEMANSVTHAIGTRRWKPLGRLNSSALLLLALHGYVALLFFLIPWIAHWAFHSSVFDLGVIENAIFNASRSGKFFTWFLPRNGEPTLYVPNNHLAPGLWFFAALYKVLPRTEWMFFFQSLALASSVIPLYVLSRILLPREMKGIHFWIPILLYVFWDPIHRMNVWDFHEVPFIIPFSLWALVYIEKGKLGWAFAFMLLMASWREDAWWAAAGLALYAAFRTKRWVLCLSAAAIGFAVFPLHNARFNQINAFGGYFGYLGPSVGKGLLNAVLKPWLWMRVAFENREFFERLVLSTGLGVFVFAKAALLPLVLPLAEIGLSKNSALQNWLNHYVGLFAGPLFGACVHGVGNFYRWMGKKGRKDLAEALLGIGVAVSFTQLAYSEPGGFRHSLEHLRNMKCLREVVALVPPDAPVIASDPVAGQLARRSWVSQPEIGVDQTEAEWLVINEDRHLAAGMVGKRDVRPWELVAEKCKNFRVYRRSGAK